MTSTQTNLILAMNSTLGELTDMENDPEKLAKLNGAFFILLKLTQSLSAHTQNVTAEA